MNKMFSYIKSQKFFKEDDTRFMLLCGLKFSAVYAVAASFIYYFFWIIISLNAVYFESKVVGVGSDIRELFVLSSLKYLYGNLPEILAIFIVIFFSGIYVGKVLLRPFELIGNYSLLRSQGDKSTTYEPDIFSDYKLITRFSEFFFVYLDESLSQKTLKKNVVPPAFSKIHGPPFERVFFVHFFILILMLAAITGFFIGTIGFEIREQITTLSMDVIAKSDLTVTYFVSEQAFLYNSVIYATFIIIIVGYIALCFHLYGKISGAIYGFFSTMRSFMKGNYSARVHLIGFPYIRPYGRAMNKYLDHVERECTMDKNKYNKVK